MLKENECQEQNCVGLTVQREARCTNDLLCFSDNGRLWWAAKSIGGDYNSFTDSITFDNGIIYEQWNPLKYDGDALRLAIKLNISIDINGMFIHADCRNCTKDIGFFEENSARHGGDILAATRVAIVRAADELGRART